MRNGKKMFVLMESVLAVLVLAMAVLMIREKNGKDMDRISVVIQNPDDCQWSAFQYGLKMAAEDQGAEVFVASAEEMLTVEEQRGVIEREIDHGADAVIVQPVPGADEGELLGRIKDKVPFVLIEPVDSEGEGLSDGAVVTADYYGMGKALAEEVIKDHSSVIGKKTFGIISGSGGSKAGILRENGFRETLEEMGAKIRWSVPEFFPEEEDDSLKAQPKVDVVIALDDYSMRMAGECSAAKDLHGALVYGIGNSTESVYYLDTGIAECLVVPDDFNMGYRSLLKASESLGHGISGGQKEEVTYTVLRRENLFSPENQKILFTMSQ